MPAPHIPSSQLARFDPAHRGEGEKPLPVRTPGFLRGIVAILAIVHAASGVLLANGRTFATSSVNATGNLQYLRKPNIELVSEVLEVKVDGDLVDVDVLYTLQNRGGAETVTYGFPIDARGASDLDKSIHTFTITGGWKTTAPWVARYAIPPSQRTWLLHPVITRFRHEMDLLCNYLT
jgi:hypothetical protein